MKRLLVALLLVASAFALTACGEESDNGGSNNSNVEFFNVKDIKLPLSADKVAVDVISGIQVWEGSSNKTSSLLTSIEDRKGNSIYTIYQDVEERYEVTYTFIDSTNKSHKASRFIQVGDLLSDYDYDSLTYDLLFADEFNGDSLDTNTWNYEIGNGNWGWGNNEKQYYTSNSKNVGVKDGNLYITALNDGYSGFNYTSARITTQRKMDFKYGYVEAKMIIPGGRGSWAAFWMMPKDSVYGVWPKSGEIDIMEHVGYDPGLIHSNTHTEKHSGGGHNGMGGKKFISDFSSNYHTYGVEWLPDRLNFFIDGEMYYTYEPAKWSGTGTITQAAWPFNQDFFLIFNLAIGGQWGGAQGIDENIFPATMLVDYVRVYQSPEIYKMYN